MKRLRSSSKNINKRKETKSLIKTLILSKDDKNQIQSIKSNFRLLGNQKEIVAVCPKTPFRLTGPLRRLKVEPHYREPTSRLWLSPQTYRKTSKIRLTGNWIEKAGFITHERIRVIPMHRMLIIVPEGCTNEHESETNEHE